MKRSEERKYFEGRLCDIAESLPESQDPYYIEGGHDIDLVDDIIRNYARNWDEVRALVDALEDTHLDDAYTPEKRYVLSHFRDGLERFRLRYVDVGQADPDAPISSEKTRAEILARLIKIGRLDFGDDPDEWRRWFKAFDEDDFFPPVR